MDAWRWLQAGAMSHASEDAGMLTSPSDPLALAHWRRTVAELYAAVRGASPAQRRAAWELYRSQRDRLFHTHSQTPLLPEQLGRFSGLEYYPYDPGWRLVGTIDREVAPETFEVDLAADGLFRYTRVARVHFQAAGQSACLSLFWLEGYGGGLFLPFGDRSNGRGSFGGGRYLYDTIKGADLGAGPDEIVLDFNYAYNPSCAYNPHWICPLSPPENTLLFPITAGEKVFGEAIVEH